MVHKEEQVEEIQPAGEEAAQEEEVRIGVYTCHCGLNIAQTVDCAAVAEYASTLPNVVVSRENMYSCADPGQIQIRSDIEEYGLNRVVVAACSVKMHGPTFMTVCEEAGLNPYLFQMVNIREHCSWVHMHDKEGATGKAIDQVRMAVAGVTHAEPLTDRIVSVRHRALVIGGGVAGLQAALDIASAGYQVFLVEKSHYLGGRSNQLYRMFDRMERISCVVTPLVMKVMNHHRITVFTGTDVESIAGYVGNFKATLHINPRCVSEACDCCGKCVEVCPISAGNEFEAGLSTRKAIYVPDPQAVPHVYSVDDDRCIDCGACEEVCPLDAIDISESARNATVDVGTVVLAVGARPYEPPEDNRWSYDGNNDVFTSLEMERMLHSQGPTGGRPLRRTDGRIPGKLAFIQCVGSRDPDENPWCSRICCMNTIKEALAVRTRFPQVRVSVYHQDIRLYKKEHEDLYRDARDAGVIFMRAEVERVSGDGGSLRVHALDEIIGEPTVQEVEMVVLATGLTRSEDSQKFQDMLKVPNSSDGFFLEAHPKLRPLETAIDGVMLAGSCQFPKDIGDSLLQASGAAAKCLGLLSKEHLQLDAIISTVDQSKCNGCLVCVKKCPFAAITIDEVEIDGKKKKRARVVDASCKGCGVCASRCKQGAIEAQGFTDEQLFAQIDAALEESPEDKILALVCHW
jgi:heterodisulfide reductase subunit A